MFCPTAINSRICRVFLRGRKVLTISDKKGTFSLVWKQNNKSICYGFNKCGVTTCFQRLKSVATRDRTPISHNLTMNNKETSDINIERVIWWKTFIKFIRVYQQARSLYRHATISVDIISILYWNATYLC